MIYFLLEKVIRYAQIDCLMGIETGDSRITVKKRFKNILQFKHNRSFEYAYM